jgi:hypothetical protein
MRQLKNFQGQEANHEIAFIMWMKQKENTLSGRKHHNTIIAK